MDKYTFYNSCVFSFAPSLQDPVPADPWTGTFDAFTESKASQRDIITARFCGSEDCLHLNIYTKQLENDTVKMQSAKNAEELQEQQQQHPVRVPVMVFFHGGAFMFGCNNKDLYDPEFLLRKDVVLVTVNYRLGALGFLSIDDASVGVPGNAGLKDQVLALRWVRDNIAAFGGDPGNVTIFGESAGGCSVHYHLLSPMSQGLFHRAIAMSGSVLTSWAICPVQQQAERLARAVGWDGNGGNESMMGVLRTVKADRLVRAQEALINREEKREYVMFPFGPKIETFRLDGGECFIPHDPRRMCAEAPWSARSVPVIFSTCSNEGIVVHKATLKSPKLIENLQERMQDVVPLDLIPGGVTGDRDGAHAKRVGAAFRQFYFQDGAPITVQQLEAFENVMSDKLFLHGVHRAMQSRLAHDGAAPTWNLRFDVDSKQLNLCKMLFADRDTHGACHADDCHYLFKTCIHPALAEGSAEMLAIDRFVTLWTEFARCGDPNGDGTTARTAPVEWEQLKPGQPIRCLNLSNELTFVEQPESERMRFWDSLYEQQKNELPNDVPAASL